MSGLGLSRAAMLAVAMVAVVAARARAASSDACARSYELAQEDRLEGRLRAAQEQLLGCAQAACPAFIRNDCTKWLEEVRAAQPTVVFTASHDGRDRDDVTVTCNQQRLMDRLDGRAIALDPGKQTCRFEAPAAEPVTLALLVIEGQKNRMVAAELKTRAAPPPPVVVAARPAVERHRGVGAAPVALAGVAVLGVAGFAVLGTSGLRAEQRLRDSCAPSCAEEDVGSVRLRYRLADVSLGVGLLSAAAATYLYWRSRDERPVDVAVTVGAGGAAVVLGSSF